MSALEIKGSPSDLNVAPASAETGVKVDELAGLVGFPVEFLKAELLIEGEDLPLESLREKVLAYLDRTVSSNQEF